MEDHLTGLPNRRAAEARLQIEWSRARREGSTFAIALMDVDRFKLVNDQHGHHVGDLALTIWLSCCRATRGGIGLRAGAAKSSCCLHALMCVAR
jgi:diguanylate cyclase (GGDEF)-like protein